MERQKTAKRPSKPLIQYSWLRDAKCRTMNPTAFDTGRAKIASSDEVVLAARLCTGCPVAKLCALEVVTSTSPTEGVIRAGIPFNSLHSYRAGWQSHAISHVARTGDIMDALARHAPTRHLDALGGLL